MRLAAFLAALLLWADAAHGVSWTNISAPFRLIGGNYCDIDNRKCHDSNNGRTATGDFWINGRRAMSRAQMRAAGIRNYKGRVVDYVRTIGVSGNYAMLMMATGYPPVGGYTPVLAQKAGSTWRIVGKTDIARTQTSSMAYEVRGGRHYMILDAAGSAGMYAWESGDGLRWSRVGGQIGESGGAFPDMAYFNGRWHLTYAGPTWRSSSVRHMSAASIRGPWRTETSRAMSAFKSVNLYNHNGALHAYSNGRHWRMDGAQSTAAPATYSGGECGRPDVRVSGKRASITWGGGRCFVKMFQGRSRVLSQRDNDGQHVQMLATGSYRVGVRAQSGGRYQWRAFRVR